LVRPGVVVPGAGHFTPQGFTPLLERVLGSQGRHRQGRQATRGRDAVAGAEKFTLAFEDRQRPRLSCWRVFNRRQVVTAIYFPASSFLQASPSFCKNAFQHHFARLFTGHTGENAIACLCFQESLEQASVREEVLALHACIGKAGPGGDEENRDTSREASDERALPAICWTNLPSLGPEVTFEGFSCRSFYDFVSQSGVQMPSLCRKVCDDL
jgi:hypothetical protein